MDSIIWICVFLPLFVVLLTQHRAQKNQMHRHVLKTVRTNKKKGGINMGETIRRFIGKKCIITTMNENIMGLIEAVEDNWVIISSLEGKTGGTEIISVDYISRIREYPKKNKK